jgi:ribose/xylose/arabinose/galactoside ABC-type transport system permease subunit
MQKRKIDSEIKDTSRTRAVAKWVASIFLRKYIVIVIFVVMIVYFSIVAPAFTNMNNLISTMIQISMLSIVSFGMTIVIINGGVDLSVGAVAGLSTIFGVTLMVYHGVPVYLGIFMGLGLGGTMGLFNGLMIARFGVAPFVATLGTMFIAHGLQFSIRHGESIGWGFPQGYINMGSRTATIAGIPIPIFIFIVIAIVAYLFTEWTTFGRYLRAIGRNQHTAEYSGVRIRVLTMFAYVISGVLAAASGLMLGASQRYIQPNLGDSFLLDALVVALLGKAAFGGTPLILGTIFGAVFVKSMEIGMAMLGAPIMIMNIAKGSLLLAALLLSIYQKKGLQGGY